MANKTRFGQIVKIHGTTARIKLERMVKHPLYAKQYTVTKYQLVQIPSKLEVEVNDLVEISETKPISKNKSWVIIKRLEDKK
jgi:small subunit ribosomal protein S17